MRYECKCGEKFSLCEDLAQHQYEQWKKGDPLKCCVNFSNSTIKRFEKRKKND